MLIIFALRFTGKRQIGELQPSELVITIMISNIAAIPIEDTGIPMLACILPILMLISFEVIVSLLGSKSAKFRHLMAGSAKVIIHGGKIDKKQLDELRLSPGDLMEEMRLSDIFDIKEVDFAVMETNGKISFYKKAAHQTATADTFNISVRDCGPSLAVVSSGSIIYNALRYIDIDTEWLEDTIKSNGYQAKDILLMTCNKEKQYDIILKKDLSEKSGKLSDGSR